MVPVSTPCIKVCIMDAPSGLCQGCGRTLDEIGRWAQFDESVRQTIMAALPARLARSRDQRRTAAGRQNRRRPAPPVL